MGTDCILLFVDDLIPQAVEELAYAGNSRWGFGVWFERVAIIVLVVGGVFVVAVNVEAGRARRFGCNSISIFTKETLRMVTICGDLSSRGSLIIPSFFRLTFSSTQDSHSSSCSSTEPLFTSIRL